MTERTDTPPVSDDSAYKSHWSTLFYDKLNLVQIDTTALRSHLTHLASPLSLTSQHSLRGGGATNQLIQPSTQQHNMTGPTSTGSAGGCSWPSCCFLEVVRGGIDRRLSAEVSGSSPSPSPHPQEKSVLGGALERTKLSSLFLFLSLVG